MYSTVATREVFWNISYHWLLYVALVPTAAIGAWGLYRRVRVWRAGQPAMRFDRIGDRLDLFIKNALGQGRTIRNRYAAVFHTGLYLGFIVLTIATTVVLVHEDFKVPIMQGAFYLIFQSLIVDLFGLFVLIAVLMAGWRRWRSRPGYLVYTDEASWILMAIFVMAFTGFVVEGWRIGATADPWGAWSPVGYMTAKLFGSVMSPEAMETAHRGGWWFHMAVCFGFLAWAPYTKMVHVALSPLNIFTANLDGYGASLKWMDFEKSERFGVNQLTDLTWKDMLDLDACTECGRCTSVCPANTVGKSLSPRDIILDLRRLMRQNESVLVALAASRAAGNGSNGASGEGSQDVPDIPTIREDNALAPESLFACTSCAACMDACPVFIEQLPKIVDARRYMVMEEAQFPEGMQNAVQSLESRQHPYPGTQFNREDWADGLELDVVADMDDPSEAEVLFWVGCGGALVERNRSTVRATAQLLRKAGVKFAVLGREESCTGDPARRIGNEFLFEMLAKGNIETLDRYGIRKVVTSCPHCFNSFRNEYPHLGGNYEVHHHSEFLQQLVADGKLETHHDDHRQVTYHDPCYLGRHNSVYDEPRELLDSTLRHELVELERSGRNSFCCGGGGGMAFVDEPPDKRVNQERAQEIVDSGADVVAVGCPFCATMLEDGIANRKGEREVAVKDVAELLLESVEQSEQSQQS